MVNTKNFLLAIADHYFFLLELGVIYALLAIFFAVVMAAMKLLFILLITTLANTIRKIRGMAGFVINSSLLLLATLLGLASFMGTYIAGNELIFELTVSSTTIYWQNVLYTLERARAALGGDSPLAQIYMTLGTKFVVIVILDEGLFELQSLLTGIQDSLVSVMVLLFVSPGAAFICDLLGLWAVFMVVTPVDAALVEIDSVIMLTTLALVIIDSILGLLLDYICNSAIGSLYGVMLLINVFSTSLIRLVTDCSAITAALLMILFIFSILAILVIIRGGAPRYRLEQLVYYNFSSILPATVIFILIFIIFIMLL